MGQRKTETVCMFDMQIAVVLQEKNNAFVMVVPNLS